MYDLFLTIAEITLAMTPLLLLAWGFAKLGKRFSAGCRYAVWCILLLRLAIPLNFTLPTPVIDLTPTAITATMPTVQAPTQIEIPIRGETLEVGTIPEVPSPAPALPTIDLDPRRVLPFVWLLGALAVLGWKLAGHALSATKLRRWTIPATDARMIDALNAAKAKLHITRRVTLRICPDVSSPMLRGLIDAEILLPRTDYTDEQLDAIFTHELIHCRRGDLWWKLVAMVATSLHFFNPLVHMAARELEIEMEQACDDAVFRHNAVTRRSYAETMLAVARQGLSAPQRGLNTHFHGPAKALKGRFANILDSSAKRAGLGIIAVTLVVALLLGALISCRNETVISSEAEVIAAAEKAVSQIWSFDHAYVAFSEDRKTATLSARHTQSKVMAWADLEMAHTADGWVVVSGEEGTRNRRDIAADEAARVEAFATRDRAVADRLAQQFGEDVPFAEMLGELARDAERLMAQYLDARLSLRDLQAKFTAYNRTWEQAKNELAATAEQDPDWPMRKEVTEVAGTRYLAARAEQSQLEKTHLRAFDAIVELRVKADAALEGTLAGAIWPLGKSETSAIVRTEQIDDTASLLFTASAGTAVVAAQAGRVYETGYDITDGNYVILSHGDAAFTRYAHLADVTVEEGAQVAAQAMLGHVGRSGRTEIDGSLRLSAYVKGTPIDANLLYLEQIVRNVAAETTAPAEIPDIPALTDPAVEISTDTAPVTAPPTYFSLHAPIAGEDYLAVDDSADTFLRYTTGRRVPVFAPAAGEITALTPESGSYTLTIRHAGGYTTRLTGLDSVSGSVGTVLETGAYLGQATETVTLYLNDAAGNAIDPQKYLHWPLKIDYIYTLHDSLPILHSWSSEIGNYLSEFATGIFGNHHGMLTYVLESLYGKDHDFGQLNLTTYSLTADGKTYRYLWRAHRGPRGFVSFAIDGEMNLLISENERSWHRLSITEKGAFPAGDAIAATPSVGANPLLPDETWFVTDPANSIVLTGIATVYIEPIVPKAPVTTARPPVTAAPTTDTAPLSTAVPVQTTPVSSKPGDLHPYTCDMPIDGIMTTEVWGQMSREYDILLAYIKKVYPGEACDALIVRTYRYEGYDRLWAATVGGRELIFPIDEKGSFLVGQSLKGDATAEQKMFSTPTVDGMPSGTVYLKRDPAQISPPWDITFPVS